VDVAQIKERTMSGSRLAVTTILTAMAAVVVGGCSDGTQPAGWRLDATLADAGSGIPFCDEVTANVADFMSQYEGQAPPSDRYGGTAVVAAIGELSDGMNGHVSALHESSQHQNFVNQMTLVQFDEELNLIPYLAESWEVSDDATEITFHIRDDVYWHDGELTDAYDVAYTYERSIDPATGFPNSGWWTNWDQSPGGMEVVDSFTVRFRLTPHAEYMEPWRQTTIMPEHLLEAVPSDELRQHPYGTVCPVGNGPFVFVEHRQNAMWRFQANPAFPDALGGRPHLDRLVYRIIAEQTTLLIELLTEGIDVYIAPPPDQVQAILDSPDLEFLHFPQRQYVYVGWNARRPQLADKRVRQALTRGTNRQEIVDALLQGYGIVAEGSVPPFHWAYDETIAGEDMSYDQSAARRLLDAAGWIDRDGDGVRENAQGDPLSISLKYTLGNQQRQDIAEIMQAQLSEIGVALSPVVVESSTLIGQLTDPVLRDFDGVVMGWVIDFKLDDTDLFHSEKIDGAYAFSGTNRSDIDHYLDLLPLILDRAEARGEWRNYQKLLIDEQPYTFFYFPERLIGYSSRLEDVVMDARGEWLNAKDWWISTDQR